jgi:predicted MFS family arabinose efflux permease
MRLPTPWIRVALAMFAVGWGANQFSPMLIVYRHALGLGPGEIAGLFTVYGVALIPGLLAGGPASDRFGRRAVVLPFAALSPFATLLLVLGPHSIAMISVGRALAGVCSGVVFGAATAWVQDLSHGDALSARRAALALSAGFALGPVTAALLAQWAGDPLAVPFLPHLAIGVVAFAIAATTPGARDDHQRPAGRNWPPAAVRTRRFWLTVAPPAPVVFGAVALAIVVLPEEVTSPATMSVGYAGLMTALTFAGGIGIQPAARRLAARREHAGIIAGLAATVAGAAAGIAAVAAASRVLAGAAAVFLGLAYGLCLVSGLSQAERVAGARDRGAVVACYYVLTYLGFAVPYVVDALNGPLGRPGAFVALTGGAAVLLAWTGLQAARRRSGNRFDLSRTVPVFSRYPPLIPSAGPNASVGQGADDGRSDRCH